MRAFLTCSLLVVSSIANAGSKVDPTGPADAETLKGNILVWHDATLFAEPSDTARTLKLATFGEIARKDRVGHVVAMKVVSGKGPFVEVELGGDEECTSSRVVIPDDLARVRMFVKRADIAPVLVKPFTKTFTDGTSISITAGTPLVATDASTYVVAMHGAEVEVDVPVASVAYAYATSKSSVNISGGQTLAIEKTTKATLGDRSLTLAPWRGAAIERRGDSAVIAVEDRCVTAHVVVPNKALADVDESTIDVGGSDGNSSAMMNLRGDCFLPKLTQLSIGTRTVAVAAKPIYLHAEPTGKNACIQRAIRIASALEVKGTDDKLRVCAPAAKVAREVMRR